MNSGEDVAGFGEAVLLHEPSWGFWQGKYGEIDYDREKDREQEWKAPGEGVRDVGGSEIYPQCESEAYAAGDAKAGDVGSARFRFGQLGLPYGGCRYYPACSETEDDSCNDELGESEGCAHEK